MSDQPTFWKGVFFVSEDVIFCHEGLLDSNTSEMLFSRETPLAKHVKQFVRTPIATMHHNVTITTSISTHLSILSRDHWVVAVQKQAMKKGIVWYRFSVLDLEFKFPKYPIGSKCFPEPESVKCSYQASAIQQQKHHNYHSHQIKSRQLQGVSQRIS